MSTQPITSADAWAAPPPKPKAVPTCPLKLPSGNTILVTRPDLEIWFTSGALPQELIDVLLGVHSPAEAAERAVEAEAAVMSDPRKARQAFIFIREAVTAAVVRPKIKLGASGPNEIEPSRIPKDDFSFVFQWVLQGCPGVPVRTEGGDASTDSVRSFRGKPGVRAAVHDGQDVSREGERAAGDSRSVVGARVRSGRRRVAKKKRS